jgi:GT2 family glycosyltransferase
MRTGAEALTYAVITPARDERATLPRLAASLAEQTLAPAEWVIVETGSSDGTSGVAEALAGDHRWVRVVTLPGEGRPERGAPVVRALRAGLQALARQPDVVVKVDADVTLLPDHFARLIAEFERDPRLGIGSGSRHELERGSWRQRHVTGTSVEGSCRAWRWSCLEQLVPLDERIGWDGLDEIRANTLGWRTETFRDLPIYHHRTMGERDPSRFAAWSAQGEAAYYMGYRPSYALLRALRHAARDPAALALTWAYAAAALRRRPRCADPGVREHVRRQQELRRLPARARETFGRR